VCAAYCAPRAHPRLPLGAAQDTLEVAVARHNVAAEALEAAQQVLAAQPARRGAAAGGGGDPAVPRDAAAAALDPPAGAGTTTCTGGSAQRCSGDASSDGEESATDDDDDDDAGVWDRAAAAVFNDLLEGAAAAPVRDACAGRARARVTRSGRGGHALPGGGVRAAQPRGCIRQRRRGHCARRAASGARARALERPGAFPAQRGGADVGARHGRAALSLARTGGRHLQTVAAAPAATCLRAHTV
jgi:hypothetical protein